VNFLQAAIRVTFKLPAIKSQIYMDTLEELIDTYEKTFSDSVEENE